MILERSKINITNLRQNSNFNMFLDLLKEDLATAREQYETTSPANECLRGKVLALKDLVNTLTGQ